MDGKDNKITLYIIIGIIVLILLANIITCVSIGFTEYIDKVAYIIKNIRFIC